MTMSDDDDDDDNSSLSQILSHAYLGSSADIWGHYNTLAPT